MIVGNSLAGFAAVIAGFSSLTADVVSVASYAICSSVSGHVYVLPR